MISQQQIDELKRFYLLYGNKPIRRYEFEYFDIDRAPKDLILDGYIGTAMGGKYIIINPKIMDLD